MGIVIEFPKAKITRPHAVDTTALAQAAGAALVSYASDLMAKPCPTMKSVVAVADLFTGDE